MADDAPWSRVRSELYALIGRRPRSNRAVAAIADLEPSHAVLDIGCGPGAAVRVAAPLVKRAVGVDRSEPMVEIARRRSRRLANVEFTVGGAEELPFPDQIFDRVWTIHSFHHWEHPDRGIEESLRVLRGRGRFLVIENRTDGVHGLTPAGADGLATRMQSIGFAHAVVSTHGKQLVVTGHAGE